MGLDAVSASRVILCRNDHGSFKRMDFNAAQNALFYAHLSCTTHIFEACMVGGVVQ